jgi:multidrug efflux pump subunit AcrA (membrane-fusion protein)
MSKHVSLFKLYLVNFAIYGAIFIFAFTFGLLALSRKVNSFVYSEQPILLNVYKPELIISNSVAGRAKNVNVKAGQRVKKGDMLIQLIDPSTDAKRQTLASVSAQNISAFTELKVLEANQELLELTAPQDGVIYQVAVAEGSYLSQNTPAITLHGNDNIKLASRVSPTEYKQLTSNEEYQAFSPRFGQTYKVVMEGAGRVIPANQQEEAKYELQFTFADPYEGPAFIQGEGLQLVSKSDAEVSKTLAEWMVGLVRAYVGIKPDDDTKALTNSQ